MKKNLEKILNNVDYSDRSMSQKPEMYQYSLELASGATSDNHGIMDTRLISDNQDFDPLFDGFDELDAISYVVSPTVLLDFFEKKNFNRVNILIGESMVEKLYKKELAGRGAEIIEKLAAKTKDGGLLIYIPKKTVHSKLYILKKHGLTRVIMGSANMTETAREAKRQINYVWYKDFPGDSAFLNHVYKDYNNHLRGCKLFMSDLIEMFKKNNETPKNNLINLWLDNSIDTSNTESRAFLSNITEQVLGDRAKEQKEIYTVNLPANNTTRTQIKKALKNNAFSFSKDSIQFHRRDFVNYYQQHFCYPLMRIDIQRKQVIMAFKENIQSLTSPPDNRERVSMDLANLEEYINTVDWGQCPDRQYAKTSIFEAVLSIFTAPFAHEIMKARREEFGSIDLRGPRLVYIYGPSHNGKTTFLMFATKLLTGSRIRVLNGKDFTPTLIRNAITYGTVFPMIFDDVESKKFSTENFESLVKQYWEVWWKKECPTPLLIFTSNRHTLKEWAQSRVKRITFDVSFAQNYKNKSRLKKLLEYENGIFKWFSYYYLLGMTAEQCSDEDEHHHARESMKKVYEFCGRELPSYFPHEPIEKIYDQGRAAWRELLYVLKKATMTEKSRSIFIDFTEDILYFEVKHYQEILPQTIKTRHKGKTLIIENPAEFKAWLSKDIKRQAGLWSRIKSLLPHADP